MQQRKRKQAEGEREWSWLKNNNNNNHPSYGVKWQQVKSETFKKEEKKTTAENIS